MSKRVTMADVAREAGVSLMTVSRVVNEKGEISDATRRLVQQVIDRLQYRPSEIARSLATNRTGTIGLVVLDNSNPFFSEVAYGVEQIAYEQGYSVFLCNTNEDPQREKEILRTLEEKRVDGVIVCSSRLEDDELESALTQHEAVVLVNRHLDNNQHIGSVVHDDKAGAILLVQHLAYLGHSQIGFVAGPQSSRSGQLRAQGYHQALEQAGIALNPEWACHCAPTVEGGRTAARALLNSHPDLTALFCFNDLTAVGTLHACDDLGRNVPEDIAVAGFDNIPLAAWVRPALTTCHIPMVDLGMEAMRLLLTRIENCVDEDCPSVVVPPQLIIRESAPKIKQ